LVTGDMVAGQRRDLNYRAMWQAFHEAVSDRLADAGIPLAVAPGNHDASNYPGYTLERNIFIDEWQRRKPDLNYQSDEHFPLYYSYRVGDALFIAIDATRVGPLDTDQREWLDQELERGAQFRTKIVYGHLPLHPFAQRREHQYLRDEALEAMLLRHDVSMFLSGHHHTYYPGRHGNLRTVGVGCLGAGARRLIGESRRSAKSYLRFDIRNGEIEGLDAYAGEGFQTPIDRNTLPPRIQFGRHLVIRDDLWRAPTSMDTETLALNVR
jgi:3',5'-cyclic AMP phosphodiesterase CpdA